MKQLLAILIIGLAALAACQQNIIGDDMTRTNETVMTPVDTATPEPEPVIVPAPKPANASNAVPPESLFTVTKTEGDLVILAPVAIDPDGGPVRYTYSKPFDKDGRWQTNFGDMGTYPVTITAYDAEDLSTSEQIRVVITRANRPPVITCPESVSVKEGETVTIDCTAKDEQNAKVVLTYDGWMTSRTYKTDFGEAGTHDVIVTADNGLTKPTKKTVKVVVHKVNRPPVFPSDFPNRISAEEGDIVTIGTGDVVSPDGTKLTFTFSTPFDAKGVWKTALGDAGQYPVDVVASDGITSTKRTVTVVIGMKNTAPVLKTIGDITVYEGETVKIPLSATDREGDKLSYSFDGWMKSQTYTTTYDDEGSYTVKVTVSDGVLSDSKVVHIVVQHRNRPPVFKVPA